MRSIYSLNSPFQLGNVVSCQYIEFTANVFSLLVAQSKLRYAINNSLIVQTYVYVFKDHPTTEKDRENKPPVAH